MRGSNQYGQSIRGSNSVRGSIEKQESHLKAMQVRIESATFDTAQAKYFITVSIEEGGALVSNKKIHLQKPIKRRTDVSGMSQNPMFNVNRFNFPINDKTDL